MHNPIEYNYYLSMDPRLYIYQLRRPRVTNPTFNSQLVTHDCFSIYRGGPLVPKYSIPEDHKTNNQSFSLPRQLNSERELLSKNRGFSHLSKYGTNSLREDRGIQCAQPWRNNNAQNTIKQPRNSIAKPPPLEDKDTHYFYKLLKTNSLPQKQPTQVITQQQIAGSHRYNQFKDKLPLNLWQSYNGITKKNQSFSPKMLNHSDEFRSVM